jgi:hypothetical protein
LELSEHQRFMLEALGRHGASILHPKRWDAVAPRLEAIWLQSRSAHGKSWAEVESVAKNAWLEELRRYTETHRGE